MDPDPATDENDLRGTISDLVDAWFRGLTVLELFWQNIDGVGVCPRATQWVHPKNYAYDQNYVLGLRNEVYTSTTSVQAVPSNLIPLPPYKFLVGAHKAKSGPALGCALLRPLAWWWCAANFSSDWLLNLAQLFGIPHRSVKYDPNCPPETLAAIDAMLQNSGSASWSRWPIGTEIEFISPNKEGSDHTPQGELMDRADRYARSLILGQTMSGTHGTTGKGGGQAFGMVERNVKEDRVDAAGKFVASVINQQLIKQILKLNYGDSDDAPTIRFLEDEDGGLVEAQRDQILIKSGLPVGVDFMRKKYGIPEPAEGEETLSAPGPSTPKGSSDGSAAGVPVSQNPTETGQTQDAASDEPPDPDTVANVSRVFAIEDDKLFSAELLKLADQLKGK
jgi:phage gp29-like protein